MDTIKPSNELEKKLNEFNLEERELIFKNTFAVQLTQGCSTGCKDCGLGATKGVTDYIPYEFVKKIIKNENLVKGKRYPPMFYFASEPFDYDFEGKNYLDIHKYYNEIWNKSPGVITSIPKGKEKLIFKLLLRKVILGEKIISDISLTKFNYLRVKKEFENYFNDKKNIPYYSLELIEKSKTDSKLDFEKFLYNISRHVYVRNYYTKENYRFKIGEMNKNNLEQRRICETEGVILTPKGPFNVIQTKVTFDNPIGQRIIPITKEQFKVITYIKHFDY